MVSKFILVAVVAGGISTAFADSVLFADDFNSEAIGLNYTGFANWDVIDGSVDLIGAGSSWDYFPSYGRYVDLDGSTNNAGGLQSKTAFTFELGKTYTLTFDLAGNQRGGASDSVDVNIVAGNLVDATITLNPFDTFTTYTYTFFGDGSTNQKILFQNAGGDNIGALLDNVQLTLVPLPPAYALAGLGVIGIAARLRRSAK